MKKGEREGRREGKKRKKTEKRRLSQQQRGASSCFLSWQDLVLGFSHELPKADDRGTSLLARFNGVGCLPTYRQSLCSYPRKEMEGPQNPKSTEKILICKENKTNKDLQDSSKSVLSPKPKLSVMFYTEPLRNKNSHMPMLLTH